MQEFLHLNGLDSLLSSLDQMSGRGFTCFTDAILQMDCISCIRCVLNTSLGLDYFISSDVYTKKLTMGKYSDTSVKETSKLLKISASYLWSIENGNRSPSIKVIIKMSELYKYSIESLLEGKKICS